MERLRENGVNPNSLFWSCHRRDALKVAVDAMRYTPGNVIFPEFMFNLAILIQGETAVLPYPGTVRDLFSVGQKRPSDPAHLALSGLIETLPVAAAYIVTTAIGLFEERHGKPPPTMENDILSLLLFYLHLIRTSVDVLGKLPGAREQKSGFFTALRAYLQKDGRGAEDAKVLMRAGCGR